MFLVYATKKRAVNKTAYEYQKILTLVAKLIIICDRLILCINNVSRAKFAALVF